MVNLSLEISNVIAIVRSSLRLYNLYRTPSINRSEASLLFSPFFFLHAFHLDVRSNFQDNNVIRSSFLSKESFGRDDRGYAHIRCVKQQAQRDIKMLDMEFMTYMNYTRL